MKKAVNLKVGVIFSLLLIFSQISFASDYILNDNGYIDKRAYEKINQIGDEVRAKLGINVFIYVKSSLDLKQNLDMKEKLQSIKNFEKKISSNLQKPYVLIDLLVKDTHVNLLYSKSLETFIDKDDILDGYIVPLLASKDKNSLSSKVSASMLNGYAAIADIIAEKRGIELKSSIGSQGKITGTIWRVFMYTIVVLGLLLYVFAVLRKKK